MVATPRVDESPTRPESDITGQEKYPVVQIAYPDEEAWAKWASFWSAFPRSESSHMVVKRRCRTGWLWLPGTLFLFSALGTSAIAAITTSAASPFPPPLESYNDAHLTSLWEILRNRIEKEPFNLCATLLFFGAIIHTFLTHRFRHIAHVLEDRQAERVRLATPSGQSQGPRRVSPAARLFHFLGEVEAVFGIWIIPLFLLMNTFVGRSTTIEYLNRRVDFTEPVFVVVVMAIASTRPILQLAERGLRSLARLGGETPRAWWLAILMMGPVLGSFITEPAAMTICALLLSRKFYALKPSIALAYGTLGLLFVNISIGGTLTHFAAPPILMVADSWGWDTTFMLKSFGWKAALAIAVSGCTYYWYFRKELTSLRQSHAGAVDETTDKLPIPLWVTVGHVLFLIATIVHAHNPPFLILGMLFFLAFVEITEDFQDNFTLRPAILVGFFLAGLVIHGGLQQWWIAPVLGKLGEVPLMLGAMALTALNDNAAITYLCTLVPTFTAGMKYAAVAGAVAGGGLTVIANAPNPAGQSILNKHFKDGVGAIGLLLGSLVPTIIAFLCFVLLR